MPEVFFVFANHRHHFLPLKLIFLKTYFVFRIRYLFNTLTWVGSRWWFTVFSGKSRLHILFHLSVTHVSSASLEQRFSTQTTPRLGFFHYCIYFWTVEKTSHFSHSFEIDIWCVVLVTGKKNSNFHLLFCYEYVQQKVISNFRDTLVEKHCSRRHLIKLSETCQNINRKYLSYR